MQHDGVTDEPSPRVAALILAAGLSSRTAPANKLLLKDSSGVAMVARIAQTCLESRVACLYIVTGHHAEMIQEATCTQVPREQVSFVHAADYQEGLSASLRAGINALPPSIDGALICLGDMPFIEATLLNSMLEAFRPASSRELVAPYWNGQRGNPVLWGRRYFPEICGISGDIGARGLLERYATYVTRVDARGSSILTDVDTMGNVIASTWSAHRS